MGGKGSGRKPIHACGTTQGYHRHRRRNEVACDLCKRAMADYAKARYKPKVRRKSSQALNKLQKKQIMLQCKLDRHCCLMCKRIVTTDNYFAFDWDHRDPSKKRFTISQKWSNSSITTLLEEIAKCDLLCAYCHRLRTHADGHRFLQFEDGSSLTLFEDAS